ncbi:hypothetical protein MIR68_008901 [Amoeboaphelidium protococcarum]|nr:hypothetical protein MIR68_008901 [Amoeboaphelidium protococcarum]
MTITSEFAVEMTCGSCVKSVKEAFGTFGKQIISMDIQLEQQRVVVQSDVPTSTLYKVLRDTGLNVVVRGVGSSLGQNMGAAVSILDHVMTRNGCLQQDLTPYGLVRLVQVENGQCWIDFSFTVRELDCLYSYLKGSDDDIELNNVPFTLAVHECGDFSQSDGPGEVHTLISDQVRLEQYGNTFTASTVIPSCQLQLHEIIGRAICFYPSGLSVENVKEGAYVGGVVARSAGLFQNQKLVCPCSGLNAFEEAKQYLFK